MGNVQSTNTAGGFEAANKVFAVPELLEQVLMHLENGPQLFALQRVNHTFRNVILRSRLLEQSLISKQDTGTCFLYTINPAYKASWLNEVFYPMMFTEAKIGLP